jgi:3-methyladenine DNA glycosylase AlkD
MKASSVVQALKKYANKEKAAFFPSFFKTGKGQYGEGDKFIGVTVPDQRTVAKQFLKLSLPEIQKLLTSKIHEHRLTALIILVMQYKKGDVKTRENIFKFYLANLSCVNNWDLVDCSCRDIVGEHLQTKNRGLLYRLAKSKNLWERRIAIVSTWAFIRRKDLKDTFAIATLLISDKHDLIHKAVGWMLREAGKRDEKVLTSYLDEYATRMPRTALRYAIERFSPNIRRHYLMVE